MPIDLNCDMGEGYGRYDLGTDRNILELVTSANLACGFHAGDPLVMERALAQCSRLGVSVGAHPGYPDLVGFGRRAMQASYDQVRSDVLYQLGALQGLARAQGLALAHVKPHGALYNTAVKDPATAKAIIDAVAAFDDSLILVVLAGPAGKAFCKQAKAAGLRVAAEFFADRTYQADGTLTPRGHPQALIHEPQSAVDQCLQLVTKGTVTSLDGTQVEIDAQTVCLHGDSPAALETARLLRSSLDRAGVRTLPLDRLV